MCLNIGLDGDGNDCLGRNPQTTGRQCIPNSKNKYVTIRNSNGGKYYEGAFIIDVMNVGAGGLSTFDTACIKSKVNSYFKVTEDLIFLIFIKFILNSINNIVFFKDREMFN